MDNLSEEEKKAIEYVKTQIKYFEEQIKFINATDSDSYDEELEMYENRAKQFNIVLNLIEKQRKEIEGLKNLNEHQSKDLTKAVNYTFELNKEIEIQDKMIDLMSEQLAGMMIFPTNNLEAEVILGMPEEVKEYYRKEVEKNGKDRNERI